MEQAVIDITYYLLHDVFQFTSYFLVLSYFLTPKCSRAIVVLLPVIVGLSPPVFPLLHDDNVSFFLLIFMLTVTALAGFEEKPIICICAIVIEIAVFTMLSLVSAMIGFFILGYYATDLVPTTWVSVAFTVIVDAVFVAAFTVLIIFWNKKVKKENEKSFGRFLLFPIGQAMFLVACLFNGKELDISLITNPYLIIALVISVVSDVTMYAALYENSRMQEMKQRVKQLEQEMELRLKYYDGLSAQFDMIREYRHDIRNMVATAKALPQTDNGERDAELLIEGMERRAEKLSIPVYCQSPLINAVLWQKSREAEQSGVRFSARVSVQEELSIDRLDMCSTLVNLLDNAIEEARKVGGSVSFSMEVKAGILFVQTENTSKRVIRCEEKPRSLKRGDHGHGSEILHKIASKYNGTYALTADGNKARAVVSMTIK